MKPKKFIEFVITSLFNPEVVVKHTILPSDPLKFL